MSLEVSWPAVHPDYTDGRVFDELLRVAAGAEPGRHDGYEWEVVVPCRLKVVAVDLNPVVNQLNEPVPIDNKVVLWERQQQTAPFMLPLINKNGLFCWVPQKSKKFGLYGPADVFAGLLVHMRTVPRLDNYAVVIFLITGLGGDGVVQ